MKTPALDLWRRELAQGTRTHNTFDPLWQAACCEMNAHKAEADGFHDAARRDLRQARTILRAAATLEREAS